MDVEPGYTLGAAARACPRERHAWAWLHARADDGSLASAHCLFIRSEPAESLVRSVLVIPRDEGADFLERDPQSPWVHTKPTPALLLEGTEESLDQRDAPVLPDRTEPSLDALRPTPGLILCARKLSASVRDDVRRRVSRNGHGRLDHGCDLGAGWLSQEELEADDLTRALINDGAEPVAERENGRQREGRPGDPGRSEREHGEIDMPHVMLVLGGDGAHLLRSRRGRRIGRASARWGRFACTRSRLLLSDPPDRARRNRESGATEHLRDALLAECGRDLREPQDEVTHEEGPLVDGLLEHEQGRLAVLSDARGPVGDSRVGQKERRRREVCGPPKRGADGQDLHTLFWCVVRPSRGRNAAQPRGEEIDHYKEVLDVGLLTVHLQTKVFEILHPNPEHDEAAEREDMQHDGFGLVRPTSWQFRLGRRGPRRLGGARPFGSAAGTYVPRPALGVTASVHGQQSMSAHPGERPTACTTTKAVVLVQSHEAGLRSLHLQRSPNELQHSLMLVHDGGITDPQHAVAQPLKVPVPTGVSAHTPSVMPAVHFHDEPGRRSHEVRDVTTNDDLAPKPNAELRARQRLPKPRFRERGRRPKHRGTPRKELRANTRDREPTMSRHEDLLSPQTCRLRPPKRRVDDSGGSLREGTSSHAREHLSRCPRRWQPTCAPGEACSSAGSGVRARLRERGACRSHRTPRDTLALVPEIQSSIYVRASGRLKEAEDSLRWYPDAITPLLSGAHRLSPVEGTTAVQRRTTAQMKTTSPACAQRSEAERAQARRGSRAQRSGTKWSGASTRGGASPNEYGEVATKVSSFAGTPFLEIAYVRDELGRITEKTETLANVTTVSAYTYDDVGRLLTVFENGGLAENYVYDANGNRTSSLNASGLFGASYDNQDRIVGYGSNIEYEFTDNGELLSRTDTATNDVTEYAYDAVGNLRGVVLPNGDEIEYLVDGQGRRVGKTVNGVFEKGWLWRGQLQPVAELDSAGNVSARFVHAEGSNVPELMVTTAATFRLVTDHLGSVRLVIDVGTGAVVQELAYDAWGRVVLDTNPGLQPFGFAGGLYEPETGLVRFGARDYDAEVGRWTSKDPLRFEGRDSNLFAYVHSDPQNRRDPSGLQEDRPPIKDDFYETCEQCQKAARKKRRECEQSCKNAGTKWDDCMWNCRDREDQDFHRCMAWFKNCTNPNRPHKPDPNCDAAE